MSRFTQRGREQEMSLDVVSAEIIYDDAQESYRNVKINDRPTDTEPAGNRWVLVHRRICVHTAGPFSTPIRTRSSGPAARLPFRVSAPRFTTLKCASENSHWTLQSGSQTLAPAYGGSVWVDPKTARVLRIEMQARNIPSDFPMDTVESAVDYSYVTIGGTSFLLPVHAESLGCQRGTSDCSHNIIDFRNYHEFRVNVKIGDVQRP